MEAPVSPSSAIPPWIQVWLEVGAEGQVFTYANSAALPAGVGDLVRVRLQGRLHTGLVVECLPQRPAALEGKRALPIEAILQAAAVDPRWRRLLETVAQDCHTSLFRCLKTALPPGWLGQRAQPPPLGARQAIQVELVSPVAPEATPRQGALVQQLSQRGGSLPLRQLLQLGFSRSLLAAAEAKGLVRRRLTVGEGSGGVPGQIGRAHV